MRSTVVAFVAAVVALSMLAGAGSGQIPPNPIIPDNGEQTLLDAINAIPLNDIQSALDHFPVPYVVFCTAGGAAPTIVNQKAGSPKRLDCDRSLSTGMGGNDIEVEVNTELLPTPHLRLNINRLGSAPFAQNLEVLIAFPFDAFNGETTLPAAPNLFMGYQTTGAFNGTSYPAGGQAPATMQFDFTPHILAGTSHTFELSVTTTGASNPVRFLSGHFDGTSATGIKNADAIGMLTDPVPGNFTLGIGTTESPIDSSASALTNTELGLTWTSTSPTKALFDYLENESFPFQIPDYRSALIFDQLPTSAKISLKADEAAKTATLGWDASAPVGSIMLLHNRNDGLSYTGGLTDVPTKVALTLHLDGSVDLDVNANTLDGNVNVSQRGGFASTSGFFNWDVGYLHAGFENAPDLHGEYDSGNKRFLVNAVNAGESIDALELQVDDGPFCVKDGAVDINCDGTIDGSDTGSESGMVVQNGHLDVNGDGVADNADDGPVPGSVPAVVATDGLVDLDANGAVNTLDDGFLTLLELPPAWSATPLQHVASLIDHGAQGTAAARAVKVSAGGFDLDTPRVIDGKLDLNGDSTVDGSDDGVVAIDTPIIDGGFDANKDGVVNGADDTMLWGRKVIDGGLDFNSDGVVNAADDGLLTAQAVKLGTTAARQLQGFLNTYPASALVPGRRVHATCDVDSIPQGTIDLGIALPPKSVTVGYKIVPPHGIDSIHCFGNVDTTAFDLLAGNLPAVFAIDFDPSNHLLVTAEDGSGPNTGTVGLIATRLCDDPNMDGVCVAGENGSGIPDTSSLLGDPVRDARARLDQSPSFAGRWANATLTAIDGKLDMDSSGAIDAADDGLVGGKSIIDGRVDLNGDGAITAADDGRFLGRRTIDGLVDVNDDGAADGNDDGTIRGTAVDYDTGIPDATLYLTGAQVAVDNLVGLPELPVGSTTADDYASFIDKGGSLEKKLSAGVFGIDEFSYSGDNDGRGLSLHYGANQAHKLVVGVDSNFGKYFTPYHPNLTLTVDKVPQTWNFFTDLANEVDYHGSAAIDSVKVNGSIDDTNDGDASNGTSVDFDLESLPKDVNLEIAGKTLKLIDGSIDVNGNGSIGSADDAVIAGVRVIDGGLDLNGDGAVDTSDDGRFIGIDVIDGTLDVNADGTVNGDDDGHRSGAMLRMNAPIDLVSLDLESTNKVVGTDYGLIKGALHDVPAHWDANWGGGAFLLESRDASDNPSPLGQVTAQISTSNDPTTNANKIKPFTEAGDLLGGPVLGSPGDAGGCRFGYSEFLQEIDKRYYSAGGASGALTRLPDLYCHSETLAAGEDHAVARTADINGDGTADEVGFADLQFTGFQKIAWIPDANGGHFTFKAPTPGLHPLFGGYEKNGTFTTVGVANIPDDVEVDIDKTEHVTEDATDDTDASVGRIGFYTGPLPVASDDDSATRAVVQFDPTPVHTSDHIHIGWAFGFPSGGAFFDSSKPIEGRLLTQNGNFRITADLRLEDILAAYAIKLFSFDVVDTFCLVPIPFDGCTPGTEIPIAWEVARAKAGIVNDADGLTPAGLLALDPSAITGNPAKQDVAGFVGIYQRQSSPAALNPSGPSPGSQEYVPLITAEEKGFTEFSVTALLKLAPLDFSDNIYPFDISLSSILTGQLVFDVWSPDDTHFVVNLSDVGLADVGFINPPDYSDNTPIHVVPGIEDPIGNAIFINDHDLVYRFNGWHTFSAHFDPFGP